MQGVRRIGALLLFALASAPWTGQAHAQAPPVATAVNAAPLPASTRLDRIAFGSCLQQFRPQPIWSDVLAARPQLMLMMGDNVYGDFKTNEATELAAAYAAQVKHAQFAKARAEIPMLAIWDDHDYGSNDAGAAFPFKLQSAQLFHRFWQLDMQRAAIDGIHYSRTFGPPGQRVQIILLDTRTHRSSLRLKTRDFAHWGTYEPDGDVAKQMLGDGQWAWLEQRLAEPADVRLIVSSIQVLAEGHGWERWGNLPHERQRLLALLERFGVSNVILLSGDRHAGGLYRLKRGGGEVVEMTSSPLNIPARGPMRDAVLPPLASSLEIGENFGLIEIDWSKRTLELSLNGREAKRLIVHTMRLDP